MPSRYGASAWQFGHSSSATGRANVDTQIAGWQMAGLMLGLSFFYGPHLRWRRIGPQGSIRSSDWRSLNHGPAGTTATIAPTPTAPIASGLQIRIARLRRRERRDDAYRPSRADDRRAAPADNSRYEPSQDDRYASQNQVGRPYSDPNGTYDRGSDRGYDRGDGRERADYDSAPRRRYDYNDGTFSPDEIRDAGHSFFGSVSKGLANVIEYAFQKQGRPNGYILGEEVGGAFVAGLRYGEGWMYTRDAGRHKVFWQGPSIGYDAGAEGSKVMVLVYNLRDPYDIYHRFGGVEGSAYVVGGAGVTFQTWGDVVLAPIRSGIGLRFGASVGYLKYTRTPTWNPF